MENFRLEKIFFGTFLLLLLLVMLNAWHVNGSIDLGNSATGLIAALGAFASLIRCRTWSQQSFVPLHRLNFFGKAWRILIAASAILLGLTMVLATTAKAFTEYSVFPLVATVFFGLLLYCGIVMLKTK